MPETGWWVVHGLEVLTGAACVVLAAWAARRVGAHTPYGTFLFVLALGFWCLLCGNLLFRAQELLLGESAPPGTIADLVSFTGWLILTVAFLLFVLRFPGATPTATTLRAKGARLALLVIPPVALTLILYFTVLAPGADVRLVDTQLQLAYVVKNGIGLGLVAASVNSLIALKESALGKLYALLGVALVFNAIGDVAWVYTVHRDAWSWIVAIYYATAGVVAFLALALHARLVALEGAGGTRFADPALRMEQRVLRDLGLALRDLVGAFGERVVVDSAVARFTDQGVPARARDAVVDADADADAWRDALLAARDRAHEVLGDAARPVLASVARAHGPEYAFLEAGVTR